MNKFMKYIAGLFLLAAFAASAQINSPSPTPAFTTNYTISGPAQVVLVSNACKIAQVQIIGVGPISSVNLYDNNATNATYTNVAYTNVILYNTNVVQTFISPLTGTTNTFTNSLYAEFTNVVSAATNALPYRTFIAPNGVIQTYNLDMIQVKGIMLTTTSTNGQVLITYRNNN